jgi:hypothetical protein
MSIWQRIVQLALVIPIVACVAASLTGDARAQAAATTEGVAGASVEPATLPDPLTREALHDLLARLSDAQVRELLIAQLDKEIAAAPAAPTDGYIDDIEAEAATLRHAWRRMFAAVPALPTVPVFLANQLIGDREPGILLLILLGIAVIFAVGGVAEWLFRHFTANLRRQMTEARLQAPLTKISYAILRFGLDLLGIAIFTAATIATFFVFYQGHPPVRLTVMMLVGAVFIVRLTSLVSRFLLAPKVPSLRLVALDDEGAAFLHRRIVWLAALGAGGFMMVDLLVLLGIEPPLAHLLGNIVAAVFVGMLIAMIWHGREPVARWVRGGAPKDLPDGAPAAQRLRYMLATMWPGFAVLYVLVLWAMSEVTDLLGYDLAAYAGIWSLVLIIAVPLIDAAIGQIIKAYVETRHGGGEVETYGRVARRALRILLIVGAVTIFARLWGINLFDFQPGGTAERLVSALVDVGLTLLVAYVGWELAKTAIDRRLALEEDATGPSEIGGEGGGQGASRLIDPAAAVSQVPDDHARRDGDHAGPVLARGRHRAAARRRRRDRPGDRLRCSDPGARHRLRRVLSARRRLSTRRIHRGRQHPRHGRAHLDPLAAPAPSPWRPAHGAVRRDPAPDQPQPRLGDHEAAVPGAL